MQRAARAVSWSPQQPQRSPAWLMTMAARSSWNGPMRRSNGTALAKWIYFLFFRLRLICALCWSFFLFREIEFKLGKCIIVVIFWEICYLFWIFDSILKEMPASFQYIINTFFNKTLIELEYFAPFFNRKHVFTSKTVSPFYDFCMFAFKVKRCEVCTKYKLIDYILLGALMQNKLCTSLRGLFDTLYNFGLFVTTLSGPSACNKFQRSSGADCWASYGISIKIYIRNYRSILGVRLFFCPADERKFI